MSRNDTVIDTHDLRKSYREVEALKGVTLKVAPGQIYGLLGQNGAGKSTLIKILLGIVKKTDGEATLLGEPAGYSRMLKRVGYLPEDHQFPLYHSGASLLDFYGQMYGLSRSDRRRKAHDALEAVGLRSRMNNKIRDYSKGMKQRVGIAQAFFHDPEVIFLDEPTDGVDPVGRKDIRDLLYKLKSEGRTIFVNSHLLGEIQMMCDRVAMLQRGQLILEGTIDELTNKTGNMEGKFAIGLAPGQIFPIEDVSKLGFTATKNKELVEVVVGSKTENIDKVVSFLSSKGLSIRYLVEKKQTLEDIFVDMVESGEPGVDQGIPMRKNRPIARGVGQ